MPSDPCQCASAGFCERFNRQMDFAQRESCATNRASYRDYLEAMKAGVSWSPPGRSAVSIGHDSACLHLGAELRQVECQSCGGAILLPVFACAKYHECTIDKRAADVGGCCRGCAMFEAKTPRDTL